MYSESAPRYCSVLRSRVYCADRGADGRVAHSHCRVRLVPTEAERRIGGINPAGFDKETFYFFPEWRIKPCFIENNCFL
jgi:hypothetical protein